jgi:predicted transcriptional regulator YheO
MTCDDVLLREAEKIVHAIGKMFAPFCEVVLHDLRTPEQSIIAIENNFSGRAVGDATTNLGLGRISDDNFPDVLQNYPNTLPDGRIIKSTSIGIRNLENKYIASICLNFDTTLFSNFSSLINTFTSLDEMKLPIQEKLKSVSVDEINKIIMSFALKESTTPQKLNNDQRKKLMQNLEINGFLRLKNAIPIIAGILGVSRGTIYNYQKN